MAFVPTEYEYEVTIRAHITGTVVVSASSYEAVLATATHARIEHMRNIEVVDVEVCHVTQGEPSVWREV